MKDIKEKHIKLINELYRSFDFFNKHFCKGELTKPIITIQKGKKNVLGWYGKDFWSAKVNDEEIQIDEINLSAETLWRKPTEVLETLLHEMAHLKNWQKGIKDCTVTQYHKKSFKESAEFFGLKVDRMGNRGYAHTSLADRSLAAIELLKPNLEAYCIVRKPPMIEKKPAKYITLQVDLSYADKLEELEEEYGKKREIAEAAIDLLYKEFIKK